MANRIESLELRVGVTMVEHDHREMFEALQELRDGVARGKKRSHTDSLLRKLAHFTLTHFALEEGMMNATRYPEMALHRLEHQWLTEQMETLIALGNRSDFTLEDKSIEFLTESHLTHVQEDDLHYSLWLNNYGVH